LSLFDHPRTSPRSYHTDFVEERWGSVFQNQLCLVGNAEQLCDRAFPD
jgi:hypothetical protein